MFWGVHGSPQESSVWATLLHMEVVGQPPFPRGCLFSGLLAERLEREADNPVITLIKEPEIRGASREVAG